MSFVGKLEAVAHGVASGWVFAADGGDALLDVEIMIDGVCVGRGQAAGLRPDVIAAGGPLMSGFEIPITAGVTPSQGRVEARVGDVVFGSRHMAAPQGMSEMFAGALEHFDGKSIEGWAVNLEAPDRPVVLSVFLGARLVGYCGASRSRPDIEKQFGTSTHLGFSYTVPGPMRELGPILYRFFVANSTVELGGSPFLVTNQPLPDETAMLAQLSSPHILK